MKHYDAIRHAYVAHYPDLFRFLRHKLGCASTAADLAQESFVRWLHFARNGTALVREPRAFLFRVARNVLQDHWRSRSRAAIRVDEHGGTHGVTGAASPERVAESRERLRFLLGLIDELPPKCRQAFTLHKFQGLSHDEVARRMGISRNMVEKHIIRAMVHIHMRMERRDSA